MPTAFETFLADARAERCWLLEIDAFGLAADTDGSQASGAFSDAAFSEVAFSEDAGETATSTMLCYSSHGFTSRAADSPASKYYPSRIAGATAVERKIYGRAGIGGLTRTFARCTLVNADGGLDTLLSSYALDGRPARLLIGRTTDTNGIRSFDARSDYQLVFSGVVQAVEIGAQEVTISFSDGIAKLRAPVNATTYAGTGGVEGGTDLKGKPKPKSWGNVLNVPAVLVDSTSLIYQVHDGLASAVSAVYDRGVALTVGADYATLADLLSTAPAAGAFRAFKASSGSYFRLGSTPAGTVTADVLGDATGGYVNKTGDILQRVLLIAGIDASLLDSASFTTLNTDAPAEVGIFTGTESVAVEAVVEQLLEGVGAFGGFSRTNTFTVGVVKAASGSAAASFTQQDIGSMRRLPLPPVVEPAVWRARVAWQRNYTVQTDLAASVTAARRAFAAEAERVAASEDLTTRGQRQLAREYGPNGNLYALEADAATEALRLLALWKDGSRGLYEMDVSPKGLARDLGDVLTVTYSRFGFSAGRDVRVLGHKVDGVNVTLTVLS